MKKWKATMPLSMPPSVRASIHPSVCLFSHLSACSSGPLHFLVHPPKSPSLLRSSSHLASAPGPLFPRIPAFVFRAFFHLHPSERTKKARKDKEGRQKGRHEERKE